MFNLLVKYRPWGDGRDTMPADRVFEYTDDRLLQRFAPAQQIDFAALQALPALFLQETMGLGPRLARIGTITRAEVTGREVALEYAFDVTLPTVPNDVLQAFGAELNIEPFEFSRTHWAIKDRDLFRSLVRIAQPRRRRPTVFQLPEHENIEPSLVSAMMPFDAAFDAVYAKLQQTAQAANMRCRRADDIWENPAIIQDVVSLIDRSSVVICDCTNRNPNVFYEIGIAHTLGREVILITQSAADIPFDLRHLRYVSYLNNGEGLAALSARLLPRLTDLAAGR